MIFMTFDQILNELYSELDQSELDELRSVSTPGGMISYHSTVGMHIRNMYKLWEPENPLTRQWFLDNESGAIEAYIIVGVDYHPCHPDNVSQRLLEALWGKVKLRDAKNAAIEGMCR